jgi:hypothetical protein
MSVGALVPSPFQIEDLNPVREGTDDFSLERSGTKPTKDNDLHPAVTYA